MIIDPIEVYNFSWIIVFAIFATCLLCAMIVVFCCPLPDDLMSLHTDDTINMDSIVKHEILQDDDNLPSYSEVINCGKSDARGRAESDPTFGAGLVGHKKRELH